MNFYNGSFLDMVFDKHFDCVVGNPPYQMRKEGFKKTQPLWHLFVQKSLTLLKEGGYMVMVHPGGWRNVDGVFKETQNILKSKEMMFLKLHNFKKGQEMFDAAITFDYYILRNRKNNGFLTKIVFEDDKEFDVDISKLEFIPNESFDEVIKLIAVDGEDRVETLHSYSTYETRKEYMSKDRTNVTVLYSRSEYGTDKKNMAKNRTNEFQYPCVYTVKSPDKGNTPTFWYSSEKKGHFGIPKVIWGNGATGVIVDKNGEYGLTQFAYAIIDDVENLENIKKAMQTERFIRNIMGFKHSLGDKYNRKIIATFRKDFWKEFMNDKECVFL